jgi:hypothetical protein
MNEVLGGERIDLVVGVPSYKGLMLLVERCQGDRREDFIARGPNSALICCWGGGELCVPAAYFDRQAPVGRDWWTRWDSQRRAS